MTITIYYRNPEHDFNIIPETYRTDLGTIVIDETKQVEKIEFHLGDNL